MKRFLRRLIPDRSFLRLWYHAAMSFIAAQHYGFPGREVPIVAVTGTNGKTSTVNLIAQFLTKLGFKVGMISTIRFQVGNRVWTNKSKMTTPGHFELHRLLREMADAECDYIVMEASSHAMTQYRMMGVEVAIAVMTNMSQDHIEYHGSYNAYRAAKRRLFERTHNGTVILNASDHEFDFFDTVKAARKFYYSTLRQAQGDSTDVRASEIKVKPEGSRFRLHIGSANCLVSLPLIGAFNVENALAAATVLYAVGTSFERIAGVLEHADPVPGRMERVKTGRGFNVVIDYAHAPDSLAGLLKFFRPLTKERLHVVFGATGGGRDKRKRPHMGEAADKYADLIYVTNDDPYEDDQVQIIEHICQGIKRRNGEGLLKILDRREAIESALGNARRGDTVIIAGKGCEEVIAIGTELLPWSDRKIVIEWLLANRG